MGNSYTHKKRGFTVNHFQRLGFAALAAACTFAPLRAAAAPIELIVPAYFYPSFSGSAWTQLTTLAQAGTPVTAIMNPGSGSGTSQNSDYVAAIDAFRAAGGKVLGYVPTGYAGSAVNASSTCQPASGATYQASDVVACAQRYDNWYNIDGIFLDEFTNTTGATELDFYRSVYASLKAIDSNWRVMGNPGTSVPPEYFATGGRTADTIVSFEQTGAFYTNYAPAPGAATGPASQFAHLVYDVASATQASAYLSRAVTLGVGSIFITNDNFCQAGASPCPTSGPQVDGNPWDTLPPYIDALAAQVRDLNAANAVPAPATLSLALFGAFALRRRYKNG
jgi:hypothetical protein